MMSYQDHDTLRKCRRFTPSFVASMIGEMGVCWPACLGRTNQKKVLLQQVGPHFCWQWAKLGWPPSIQSFQSIGLINALWDLRTPMLFKHYKVTIFDLVVSMFLHLQVNFTLLTIWWVLKGFQQQSYSISCCVDFLACDVLATCPVCTPVLYHMLPRIGSRSTRDPDGWRWAVRIWINEFHAWHMKHWMILLVCFLGWSWFFFPCEDCLIYTSTPAHKVASWYMVFGGGGLYFCRPLFTVQQSVEKENIILTIMYEWRLSQLGKQFPTRNRNICDRVTSHFLTAPSRRENLLFSHFTTKERTII